MGAAGFARGGSEKFLGRALDGAWMERFWTRCWVVFRKGFEGTPNAVAIAMSPVHAKAFSGPSHCRFTSRALPRYHQTKANKILYLSDP